MPSDTFSHTTSVAAAPATIYSALQDPDTWRGIGPIDEVWDAIHDHNMLTGFRWSTRAAGKSWTGSATRSAFVPGDSITLDLDSSEIAGTIKVELAPVADGTRLTVTMLVRSKGFLAGMFWSVISDALREGLAGQVESFGDEFRNDDCRP